MYFTIHNPILAVPIKCGNMWQKSPVMQLGSQLADNSHAYKNIQNKIKQQADEKRDWMNADFFLFQRVFRREYWMYYREPGLLTVVLFGSTLHPSPVSKLDLRHTQEDLEWESTCWRERGEGRKKEPNHNYGEKAWCSILN